MKILKKLLVRIILLILTVGIVCSSVVAVLGYFMYRDALKEQSLEDRVAEATWNNIKSWSLREGGSTITQQLAKNLYFTQERSFIRKAAEMFMAFRLEQTYTKDEILELYVNSIYFGDGYYCVRDASEGYFGKEPGEMTDYESTLLAGIPNAPSVYSLTANPDLAEQRQQYVLRQMEKYGYLDAQEANAILQNG